MFTETQLDLIREAARKTKNQGELAVYEYLRSHMYVPDEDLRIIKYCAEECKRQRSGEMSVYNMIYGWNQVQGMLTEAWEERPKIDLDFIRIIGFYVEPDVNRKGFRTVQVGVNTNTGFKEFIPWANIERNLQLLLDAYYSPDHELESGIYLDPALAQSAEDVFYYEYEQIHPFRDGNGRSGKIIYNSLTGTLDNPVMPPNFFADEGGIP